MYATFSARWQRRYSLELWLRQTKPDASSDALKLRHTSVMLSVTGIESLWISTLDSSGVSLDEGTTGMDEDSTGTELDDEGITGTDEDSTGTELEDDSTGTVLEDELGAWSHGFSSVHTITGATQTVPLAHSRIVQTFSGEWHWMYSGLVLLMQRKPLASGSGSYSSQIIRMVSSVSEDDSGTGTELEDAGTVLDEEVTGIDDDDDDITGTELDEETTGIDDEDEDTGTVLDDDSTGTELEEDSTGTELDEETTGMELDEDTGTELDEETTGIELDDDSTGTELDDSTGMELDDSTGSELEEEPWLHGFSSVHSIAGAIQRVPLAHLRMVHTFSGEWHWM